MIVTRTKMMRLAGSMVGALMLGAAAQDISVPPGFAVGRPAVTAPVATSDPGTATEAKPAPSRPAANARASLPVPPIPPPAPALRAAVPAAAPPVVLRAPALTAPLAVVNSVTLPAPGLPAAAVDPVPASLIVPTPAPTARPASSIALRSGAPQFVTSRRDQDPPPDPTVTASAVPSPTAVSPTAPSAAGPSTAGPGPTSLAARLSPSASGPGFLVPLEAGVGAAAFRRGGIANIVFDQRRPFDLAALRAHPQLGGAYIQLLPAGTVLRMQLPPETELALARVQAGWQVTLQPSAAPTEPIRTTQKDARLLLAATAASAVVAMTDPETGATLLIGTQNRPGQAIMVDRHWANFTAIRSWLGLVIEPLSDRLALRVATDGFILAGGADGLALSEETPASERMAQANPITRRFHLPGHDRAGLLGLQHTQLRDAADAPALARGPKRRALGQTLIALGLGAEAQSVLQIAAMDDPREADAPEAIGLTAIAALLAGRVEEAAGLDDPRLNDNDEVRFWRAIRMTMRPTTSAPASAADDFAATLPLLPTYPDAVQERLVPLVAETLLLAEQTAPARTLITQLPDHAGLAFARALLLHADGQVDKALAELDVIGQGRDRLARAKAGARAVEIRLARGDLSVAAAADALDRLVLAWRGDARDLALRLRVAELRIQAGIWRPALALLRETEAQFPDDKPLIQARQRESVAQLLRGSAIDTMASLDLVSLIDENADLMPGGAAGAQIAARLAERLTALDLPRRATPLLQKLIAAAPAGPVRAQFGTSLAALRLQEADPAGTLAALDSSAGSDLPALLVEERTVLAARARARQGDHVAAISLLANLDSDAALRARATILEEQRNWPQATEALRALITRIVPAEGALDDGQQRSLLRLATAAAQAGDSPLLAQLRDKELPRLSPGPVADLFRLLTADSIQNVTDLPRSGRELALARALSAEPARR